MTWKFPSFLTAPQVPQYQHAVTAPFQHHPALAQPELEYDNLLDYRHKLVVFCSFFLTSCQLQLRAWPVVLSGLIFHTDMHKCLKAPLRSRVLTQLIMFSKYILQENTSSQKILAHKIVTWLLAPFNKTSLLQDGYFYVFSKSILFYSV